jgi:hypothetical protein
MENLCHISQTLRRVGKRTVFSDSRAMRDAPCLTWECLAWEIARRRRSLGPPATDAVANRRGGD